MVRQGRKIRRRSIGLFVIILIAKITMMVTLVGGAIYIAQRVSEVGLKTMIERIWEGPNAE